MNRRRWCGLTSIQSIHHDVCSVFGALFMLSDLGLTTTMKLGKKTEMSARFSTVAGERGAADAERDIRGFALMRVTGTW